MPAIPRNYAVAGGIALAVIAWMLSGLWSTGGGSARTEEEASGEPRVTVETRPLSAEPIERRIVVQGQVRPDRAATLRAQTAGQVVAVAAEPGQRVAEGDVLVRLALDDRPARLDEARALLRQRVQEYEAAQRLGDEGFQAQVRIDEAAAALAAARAAVARIELDIERTRIRAPFDGIVDERPIDVGDYASVADAVVSVVDNDPLVAEAWLSQRDFDAVRVGRSARVTLVSGERRNGPLKTIAPRADAASRMFRVEVQVENPAGVPANTSAEIEIPVETVAAHRLSPALLALDADGALGVKTVGDDGRVAFHAIEIVRADADGVWVTGLPERARVITAGGGFVAPGETVDAVETAAGTS